MGLVSDSESDCMLTLSLWLSHRILSLVSDSFFQTCHFYEKFACWQKKTERNRTVHEATRITWHTALTSELPECPFLQPLIVCLHISTLHAAVSSCCVSIKTAGEFGAHCSTASHSSTIAERSVDTHQHQRPRFLSWSTALTKTIWISFSVIILLLIFWGLSLEMKFCVGYVTPGCTDAHF